MSLNVTQSNQNLTLHVSQSNVKATLSVTQNINELHITAIQNNEITKLQPIVNTNSPDYIETDPIFQASEASLFVAGDKTNLDNQSGINTGDETTLSIQTKRPLKTINNESLEGSGNVQINYNDLDNLPTIVNDKNYVHNQIVASNFWEIQHNLDKYPSVSIIDSGNNLVVGEIKYIDSNNIIITFTSVFSGKAYFN